MSYFELFVNVDFLYLKKADAVLRFYAFCIFTFRHAAKAFYECKFSHLDNIIQPLIVHEVRSAC